MANELEEMEEEDDIEMDEFGEIVKKSKAKKAKEVQNKLWIDKYTSEKFFDLLTDEVTNRNVLTWLKTWDELVFPDNPKFNAKVP